MTTLYMLAAIGFETAWAVAMKASQGLTRPLPTAVTIVCYLLSVVFLALATRRLELGIAYAIWAGSGVALIAVIGVMYFGEPMSAGKALSMLLIVAGIVGVHLSSPRPGPDQADSNRPTFADSG